MTKLLLFTFQSCYGRDLILVVPAAEPCRAFSELTVHLAGQDGTAGPPLLLLRPGQLTALLRLLPGACADLEEAAFVLHYLQAACSTCSAHHVSQVEISCSKSRV
jgi:hypothetical protein